MTDRGPLFDQNDTPEDVATLYSWANLHGAKYRDFSEARAQSREKTRLRLQQAIEEEQARAHREADRTAEAQPVVGAVRMEEQNRHPEWAAGQAAEAAAAEAVRQAAQRAQEAAAEDAIHQAEIEAQEAAAQDAARREPQHAQEAESQPATCQAAEQAQEPARSAHRAGWRHPLAERFSAFVVPEALPPALGKLQLERSVQDRPTCHADTPDQPVVPQAKEPPMQEEVPNPPRNSRGHDEPLESTARPAAPQPQGSPLHEEGPMPPRTPWGQVDPREHATRPAWLTPERSEPAASPAAHRAPEDTLQGSRERLASRWYALRGVFEGISTPPETAPAAPSARAPVVAVFSLAGGVGKTSLVATLGRALSARGERVLLVDTAAYGLMPFFFGAHDQRPGVLRTFSPPGTSGDAPIQMVTLDPESLGPETAVQEALAAEISKYSRGVSRVIVDLATASGATSRRVMKMAPLVLVPMVPDMNSIVSVSSIDSFFQHNQQNGSSIGKPSLPFYVLNQFDPSLPLHLDIREVLREQLGERLLPFALRRNPAVSEALAEGMTVVDYAPNSTVAEDFGSLAGWVKNLSAPASSAYRGVRWSER